ncbi:keratin-associated protein 16-1-like [Cydia amplana]|uniref:keratin-associated protein 16-1-like n=1 Tax=Cydia amplana TaxID=1869771 RepID=UPI002FE5B3FE
MEPRNIKCSPLIVGAPPGTLLHQHSPEEQELTIEVQSWHKQLHNRSEGNSVCFANSINYFWKNNNEINDWIMNTPNTLHMPKNRRQEITTVYMTLYDQFCRHRTSGTQATASINKSFQVSTGRYIKCQPSLPSSLSKLNSPCSIITNMPDYNINKKYHLGRMNYSEMYFFSKKNKKDLKRVDDEDTEFYKSYNKSVQVQSCRHSTSAQTNKKQASLCCATATSKAVSIKEPDKQRCSSKLDTNNDFGLSATISHIKIVPRQSCPIHGTSPCQGPNCKAMGLGPCSDPCAPSNYIAVNSDSGEQTAPIKVSTTNNPRRGVFELVIRRLNGAPLARNELFLEWSPPPGQSASCCGPYPLISSLPGPCRPSKCKIPVCRPPKPRCCKKPLRCKFPCGPKTSRCGPCSLCGRVSCPGCPAKPCCRPCAPKPCRPRPCRPKPRRPKSRVKRCKPCKPCKPCCPPFPFKPSCTSCSVCCGSIQPCSKPPCKPCRTRSPCKSCKPPSCKPCRPCFPYRPCVPDLACPKSKTSIVFATCKSKPCKPCSACDPCGSPFPACFSCYPCITPKSCLPNFSSTFTLCCPPSKSFIPSNTCISSAALAFLSLSRL